MSDFIPVLCVILMLCQACSKSSPNPSTSKTDTTGIKPPAKTVYVLGFEVASNKNYITEYWKNGKVTVIQDSTATYYSSDMAIIGSDIYINGVDNKGHSVYWKNGILNTIPNDGTAFNICTSGADFYILGSDTSNISVWKDNVEGLKIPVEPTDLSYTLLPVAMATNGTDIYIATNALSDYDSQGFIFKNGVKTILPQTSNGVEVYGAALSGNDFYVLGTDNSKPVYWKNGVELNFNSDVAAARVITVVGTDVYIGGTNSSNIFTYWKNGLATPLPDAGDITSIAVDGSDIYVSGYTHSPYRAAYWKNGAEVLLTNGARQAGANKIIIQ